MSLFQYDRAVRFPLKTISNLKLALFFTARTKRIKRYIISILVGVIYNMHNGVHYTACGYISTQIIILPSGLRLVFLLWVFNE